MGELKITIIFCTFFIIGAFVAFLISERKKHREEIPFLRTSLECREAYIDKLKGKNNILRAELDDCRDQLKKTLQQNEFLKAVIEADRHRRGTHNENT